ncbi:BCAM0308 family protein [Crenobacter sp. SG2303]|uniref:BCAM0308 family protein n=1 Tax=Crenobacter oryzisoli TaxID=3056844 RepID=A0ABT7XV73_9NEIS|nr:BCAM0308 family protein [Crenobacter sp. SG2303]MDN0077704.1 BCAM0308 family protein [Crenobacter sp. SG2303]
MTSRTPPAGFQTIRRDQLRQEREHDSYKLQHKLPEPAVCPDCGAVFHAGRWQWGDRPNGASEVVCAACHRIRDHFPAGFVHIGGKFFGDHRDELTALIRHHEDRAKAEHPQARIIDIEQDGEGVLITTTDIHLARDLGEALHHAYQGDLEFHYNEAQKLLRVHWLR